MAASAKKAWRKFRSGSNASSSSDDAAAATANAKKQSAPQAAPTSPKSSSGSSSGSQTELSRRGTAGSQASIESQVIEEEDDNVPVVSPPAQAPAVNGTMSPPSANAYTQPIQSHHHEVAAGSASPTLDEDDPAHAIATPKASPPVFSYLSTQPHLRDAVDYNPNTHNLALERTRSNLDDGSETPKWRGSPQSSRPHSRRNTMDNLHNDLGMSADSRSKGRAEALGFDPHKLANELSVQVPKRRTSLPSSDGIQVFDDEVEGGAPLQKRPTKREEEDFEELIGRAAAPIA